MIADTSTSLSASLKPYAEYKESGLPWLGQVPGHWEIRRAKSVTIINPAKSEAISLRHSNASATFLPMHRVGTDGRFDSRDQQPVTALWNGFTYFRRGDVLVAKITPCFENGKGACLENLPTDIGFGSTEFHVLRPKSVLSSRFLFYQTRVHVFRDLGANTMTGSAGQQRVPSSFIENYPVLLPPPAEQAAIVRFLDWATGRLERAIRAKRKVIALLHEQKQAIIQRAVTRGLDPAAPLKDSGVPWLGEIPAHWSLKRFKFLATINSGQVDPRKPEYRGLVLIAPNHIQSGSGRLLSQETADEQGADSGKYFVSRGQVIYSKIRPSLRKATIAPCDCLCSADMYPITPATEGLSTAYLLLLLLSQPFTKFAVDSSMRVAMPKVNREALANCLMWYPNPEEQSQILGFVARESAPLDTAISRLEREIDLLREYRTRLVADVVTGKLDVRAVAASLPVEVGGEEVTENRDEATDEMFQDESTEDA